MICNIEVEKATVIAVFELTSMIVLVHVFETCLSVGVI